MAFTLPSLSYNYYDLQPYIDEQTMTIHHSRHHQGYVDNLNTACDDENLTDPSWETLFKVYCSSNSGIRNNGGGTWNHSLFFDVMSPNGGGSPSGTLLTAINTAFTSFSDFKDDFSDAAAKHFGSGWAWLGVKTDGSLVITATPNQDNPMMKNVNTIVSPCTPILGLDVWEHAYYLNCQNRRGDYIANFFNVVDWGRVQVRYNNAIAALPNFNYDV